LTHLTDMSCSTLGKELHRNRSVLYCGIQLLILAFYSYLKLKAIITNGWESDTEYCFAQVGKCMARHGDYGIVDNVRNEYESSSAVLPVCYSMSDDGSSTECYSSDRHLECTREKWITHGYDDIRELFQEETNPSLVKFDVAIIILSILVLILTVLFSGPNSCFASQDQVPLTSHSDMRKMMYLSLILTVIQLALMVTSSQILSFITVASCGIDDDEAKEKYKKSGDDDADNHNGRELCDSCNANIRSIVFPKDSMLLQYSRCAIILSMALMCSSVYNMVYLIRDDELSRVHVGDQRSANDPYSAEASETLRYLAYLSATRFSDRHAMSRYVHQESATDVYQDHRAFKFRNKRKMSKWKFGNKIACGGVEGDLTESSSKTDECAICLEPLTSPQTADVETAKTAPDIDNSHTCEDMRDVVVNNGDTGRESYEDRDARMSRLWHARVMPYDPTSQYTHSFSYIGHVPDFYAPHTRQTPLTDSDKVEQMAPVEVPCGHVFHERCICAWMRAHATCPICRADLETGRGGNNDDRDGSDFGISGGGGGQNGGTNDDRNGSGNDRDEGTDGGERGTSGGGGAVGGEGVSRSGGGDADENA
jgi:hypothetical protein